APRPFARHDNASRSPSMTTGRFALALVLVPVLIRASLSGQAGSGSGGPTPGVGAGDYPAVSPPHPRLKTIKGGETVSTKTLDAGGQDEKSVRRSEPGNPLTGPFAVEGAEPGDALAVHLKKVRMNRDWGWTANRLGLFALTPEAVEHVYSNVYKP